MLMTLFNNNCTQLMDTSRVTPLTDSRNCYQIEQNSTTVLTGKQQTTHPHYYDTIVKSAFHRP